MNAVARSRATWLAAIARSAAKSCATASLRPAPSTSHTIQRARSSAGSVSVRRRVPLFGPLTPTSRVSPEQRVPAEQRCRVAIVTEPEVHDIENGRVAADFAQSRGIAGRGKPGVPDLDGHRMALHRRNARGERRCEQMLPVARLVVDGNDAFIDLEEVNTCPRHIERSKPPEHGPRRAPTAHGERRATSLADGMPELHRDELRRGLLGCRDILAGDPLHGISIPCRDRPSRRCRSPMRRRPRDPSCRACKAAEPQPLPGPPP